MDFFALFADFCGQTLLNFWFFRKEVETCKEGMH
jgi:hypothetical protein